VEHLAALFKALLQHKLLDVASVFDAINASTRMTTSMQVNVAAAVRTTVDELRPVLEQEKPQAGTEVNDGTDGASRADARTLPAAASGSEEPYAGAARLACALLLMWTAFEQAYYPCFIAHPCTNASELQLKCFNLAAGQTAYEHALSPDVDDAEPTCLLGTAVTKGMWEQGCTAAGKPSIKLTWRQQKRQMAIYDVLSSLIRHGFRGVKVGRNAMCCSSCQYPKRHPHGQLSVEYTRSTLCSLLLLLLALAIASVSTKNSCCR
jgi:hypothetical protein